jgi:SynChlorMet cassette radical SAM/SPASM protein ScmE
MAMAIEPAPALDLTTPWPGLPSAPRSVDVSLTGCCNLRCWYCSYADEMATRSDLPTERWLSFFEELGQLAVQHVCLTGGEVFTRPDLFTLIDSLIANKMRYSILTNGTLITEQMIERFGVSKRRLRLDYIQVSIDGSRAEVHDRSRPPASFERAMHGLRLLRAHGLPVTVRVTINHYNVDDLVNIAQLLLEDIGLPSFSTNEAEQMGTARCNGQDVVLTEAERRQAMETLTRLNEQYGGRIHASAGPLARARLFSDIEARLAHGETQMPGCGTLCSCGYVFDHMAVLHDGSVTPCNLLPTLTMGMIGVNSLQDIWRCHPAINIVRQRRRIPLSTLLECADCPYTGFCSGGCPATVMAMTGRLDGPNPLACYRLWKERKGDADLHR